MSNNKLGVHVATGNRDGYANVAASSRIVVSLLADAALEIGGNTFFVYRPGSDVGIYTYDGQNNINIMPGFNNLTISDMIPQAEYWWPKILSAVESEEQRLGISIDAIQPINEAEGDDPAVIEMLIAYETRLMELANQSNRKLVFASYAPISPHIDLWKQYSVPFIKRGWELGHIYGRHVYLDFDPQEDNRTRIFDEIVHFKSLNISVGPIILTEWGFISFPGSTEFMSSIKEWDNLIAKHNEIGGLAAFTYGEWVNANIQSVSPELSIYLQENPPTKWNPFPVPPPVLQEWQAASIILPDGVLLTEKITELENRISALEGNAEPPPIDPLPLPDGHNCPLGVDVSKYQYQNTNWTALKQAGVSFAFIRLGSAYTLKDANFDWNWQNAGLNNILRGAYWYLYPNDIMSISSQVDHVFAIVPTNAELPLVLDVEQSGLTATEVCGFLSLFGQKSGYKPIIYTGAWYWVPNMGSAQTWAAAYDLWVANYTLGTGNIPSDTFSPRLPDVWSKWKFWQWTSSGGELVGQSFVPLDLNYFNGTPEQLLQYSQQFINRTPPTTAKVDMLPYIQGVGVLYEVRNEWGSQERFQTQIHGSQTWQTKNDKAECFIITADFVYRDWDLSPGGDRFYRLLESGIPASKWIPRHMAVGETFVKSRRVQYYNWDCSLSDANSGDVTDTMKFVAHHDSYTFKTGITLNDVIELVWANGPEHYFYANGYGLVAWEREHDDPNTPKWSAISEIHAPGQRPDNAVKLPSCLS